MKALRAAVLLAGCACAALAADRDELIIIPHTHWEGAVFKTREEYLAIGLPHILEALQLLKKYPGYRFVLDQMCYVKPFLERYPAEAPAFREALARGQLEIAGGTVTMHDNNVPSGESIVHQYLIGKWFFRDRLGYEVKTGWGLDTFGHNAQMPQILKLAGMDSYWFQRGVPSAATPAEFLWQGLDGTRIPAFWLPIGYGGLYDTPKDLDSFTNFLRSRYEELTPFARGYGRVLLAGADVSEPEAHLPPLVGQLELSGSLPFHSRFGLPSDYAGLIAKRRPGRDVIGGEMNPVFQGVYSTRIEVKGWMRELERTLTSAEKAAVMANRVTQQDREAIEHAWEPVLFNQAHDLSSGVMMDKVYDDAISTYRDSRRQGDEILNRSLDEVAAQIDTRGAGAPLVVFNLLGWERTDLAEAVIGFSAPDVRSFALLDAAGKAVPYQINESQRSADSSIQSARIAFIARKVPSMGYAVYHVAPNSQASADTSAAPLAASGTSTRADTGTIENEFYRAAFNLWTGAMTSLVLKQEGSEMLRAPGNVVAREEDGGDFWELYGTLNGARFTAMGRADTGPRPERTVFSTDNVGGNGSAGSGPVFVQFHISHPFGKNQFATRVRMYPGIRRIDIQTQVLNQEPFVRYRVLFPTTLHGAQNVQEIPFGSIQRPADQEFPAQNWVDASAGGRGIALLNRGLPGNTLTGDTLLLSLMRSTRLISYGGGDIEPGNSSDSALELGKKMTFDYALVPHTGTWQDGLVSRAGLEFNNPLIVRNAGVHAGSRPRLRGFLDVSNRQVIVSAIKPSRDGDIALRVYEAAGQPARGVRIQFAPRLVAAWAANLIEDKVQPLPVADNALSFDLQPYEIKTLRLRLEGF
ncbi:MAG TPA: glycoside hydrolase family 38 C-terminal domain-containing protein [Bryobacteraceae bacterium]|nr:glycoside hydrolase family 38 C-terminal domain-containing protein [Bryobacteraceae bacterium]